jgi:hypothetical protein
MSSEQNDSSGPTKKSSRRISQGFEEPRMIYLVPSPNKRSESVMRIVTTFLLFLLGLIGIAMLLQLSGCSSYEGRLLKGGTKVFAAGCGTAETDFECLDQIDRVRELTEHAYEV